MGYFLYCLSQPVAICVMCWVTEYRHINNAMKRREVEACSFIAILITYGPKGHLLEIPLRQPPV